MATTFTKIASVTVGSGGAATIDFTSIPSTYTDLVIKASVRDSSALTTPALKIVFNSDTGSNYPYRLLYGDGSAAASLSGTLAFGYSGAVTTTTQTSNTFTSSEIYIPNYRSSSYKSSSVDSVQENNGTAALAGLVANLWNNTNAITSITLSSAGGNFVQYSTATLYGVSKS
jgi:hypothetical protein